MIGAKGARGLYTRQFTYIQIQAPQPLSS